MRSSPVYLDQNNTGKGCFLWMKKENIWFRVTVVNIPVSCSRDVGVDCLKFVGIGCVVV